MVKPKRAEGSSLLQNLRTATSQEDKAGGGLMPPEHHLEPGPVLTTEDAGSTEPLDALKGLTGLWGRRHGDKGVLGWLIKI